MSRDIPVNRFYAVVTGFFAALFLLAALSLLLVGSWAGGGVCALLAAVYAAVSVRYGAVVHIDAGGVSRRRMFRPEERYAWAELKEVGIFGSRLFHKAGSDKVGTLYLYFSAEAMTEDERFSMVLKWPPQQIHFLFDRRHLELVQYFWGREVVSFNTGSLRP